MDVDLLLVGKRENKQLNHFRSMLFNYAKKKALDVRWQDYDAFSSKEPFDFQRELLNVYFFFPFKFWDKNCENPEPNEPWGTSKLTYERFKEFWTNINKRVNELYPNKELKFVVDPKHAFQDRDKIETRNKLAEAGLPVTETIESRDLEEILEFIEPKRGVFIKSRYGGSGKGITYLSEKGWFTNYKVDDGRLSNHELDKMWLFVEITNQDELVSKLLEKEVIIEKEVITPELSPNEKYDVRAYATFNDVPHMFVRVAPKTKIVTNWYRGGKIIHTYADVLNKDEINEVKELAWRSAEVMKCQNLCGIDIMFDKEYGAKVIETQVFTGFPNHEFFNLPHYIVDKVVEASRETTQ